jgi:catechol 2,3-dioxygenase-like lactoylglutathione lyase family enzyme
MITHLAGIAEIVEDVEAAVEFYREGLKLEVKFEEGATYAQVNMHGILHFGIWSRAAAAETVFGNADKSADIPLGFTIGFETESVESAEKALKTHGIEIAQSTKTESWGQVTSRFMMSSGALGEFSETPWARILVHDVAAESVEDA